MTTNRASVQETLQRLSQRLLAARVPSGHWEGRLSSSALSTATAIAALALANPETYAGRIQQGLDWLARNQNSDGGWGDTVKSFSNISTTMLARAVLTYPFRRPETLAAVFDRPGATMQRWDVLTGRRQVVAVAAGGVLALALLFELFVVDQLTDGVLRCTLDALPRRRGFFGNRPFVVARRVGIVRIVAVIPIVLIGHVAPPRTRRASAHLRKHVSNTAATPTPG